MNYETKNEFRQKSIARLKVCSRRNKLKKDKEIVQNIVKVIEYEGGKNLLLYLPLKMEVDVRSLFLKLRKKGYKIFVPFMVGETLKIVPYRLPLKKKKYNIYEPNTSTLGKRYKLDIALVPVVGIDPMVKRIGFGAGFYDRFFDSLGYKPKIIFTQLCLCKSKKILSETHDIQGDWVVTHKGIMR